MTRFHTDRGELARPVSVDGRSVFEGVAGRAHPPHDPLEYTTGPEHRDQSEVASIARQLAGGKVPVTIGHPSTMPATSARDARIVGVVTGGRLDGDRVVATLRIDDRGAVAMIGSGMRELSLGYGCDLDAKRFQRSIEIDHLAIVSAARCGSTCSLRADSKKAGLCMCNKDKLDGLDREQLARLNMRADSEVRHIADEGDRARVRQRFVDRELAKMDEKHGPFEWDPMTLERGRPIENVYAGDLSDVRAQIAMAARSASAWIMDDAARAAAIEKYVTNALGRRGIKS